MSLSATRSFYRGSKDRDRDNPALAGKTPFAFLDWTSSYVHLRFLTVRARVVASAVRHVQWRSVVYVAGLTGPSVT